MKVYECVACDWTCTEDNKYLYPSVDDFICPYCGSENCINMFITSPGYRVNDEELPKEITVNGTVLDDYIVNNEEGLRYAWSQVCDEHVVNFPESMVDYNSGHGICGVKGCNKEADHYIDFNRYHIEE